MSDWSLHELENIAGNEFGISDDHIVPHQGVEQVNEYVTPSGALKKPCHDVENVVNSTDGKGSATKTAFWKKEETIFHSPMEDGRFITLEGSRSHEAENIVSTSCDPEFITSASALAFKVDRSFGECVNDCNLVKNNDFCPKVPPAVNNLDLLENENVECENDLVYYDDLPDIGNFDDNDGMFRNWDATLGPDELSWFSSSSNIVNFDPGLQSSCSELRALNDTFGHHGAHTNFLSKSDQPTAHDCYQSYNDWVDTDAEYKDESALSEQIKLHQKNMESHYLSEGKRKKWYADQKLLSSAISTRSSQYPLEQKHFLEAASSSHVHSINTHPQLEYGRPTHLVTSPQETSSIKFETEIGPSHSYKSSDNVMNRTPHCTDKLLHQICRDSTMKPNKDLETLRGRHQLSTTMIGEHMDQRAYFTSKPSLQKKHWEYQHEIRANSEVENISLEPGAEKYSSIIQEGSCMTSVCPDDVSLEATNFRQLQNVMDQLDIRTKLCIRDSLYRLAWSAKQRHAFADTNNCSRVSKDTRGFQGTKEPRKGAEFMDAETVTNPIDRSIARLLFTGLPEPATKYSHDL